MALLEEISDPTKNGAQVASFSPFSRQHPDPRMVKRCYRPFQSATDDFHEACERGLHLLRWIPELKEDPPVTIPQVIPLDEQKQLFMAIRRTECASCNGTGQPPLGSLRTNCGAYKETTAHVVFDIENTGP
jgi:hypothetical protein